MIPLGIAASAYNTPTPPAAIQPIGSASGGRSGTGSFSVTPPAAGVSYLAVAQGVLSSGATSGAGTITPPAGWALVSFLDQPNTTDLWPNAAIYKSTTATPGSSWGYTVAGDSSSGVVVLVVGYDGEIDPKLLSSTYGASATNPINSPSINLGDAGLIARIMTVQRDSSYSAPTYPTSAPLGRYVAQQNFGGGAAYGFVAAIAHEARSVNGATNTAQWNINMTPYYPMAHTIALPAVVPIAEGPVISTANLGTIRMGTAYSLTLAATGDTPISYDVVSGALPAGLELNSSTGTISGTPEGDWSYNVTIRATNSTGSNDKQFSGNVLFPSEVSRIVSDNYARITLSLSGNPTIVYAPLSKTVGSSTTGVIVAHGATDNQTLIDNSPLPTVEHCISKGWVAICPYAENLFGNDLWQSIHLGAAAWIDSIWPIDNVVLYGPSMGAYGCLLGYAKDIWPTTYDVRGLVAISTPFNLRWHWDYGGTEQRAWIREAFDVSPDSEFDQDTNGYRTEDFPGSAYTGVNLLYLFSPADSATRVTEDHGVFQSVTSGNPDVTIVQTTGQHYEPGNFAPTVVNNWLDTI